MRTILGCGRFHCVHPDAWVHIDKLSSPNSLCIDGDEPHTQLQECSLEESALSSCSSDDESLEIDWSTRENSWVNMLLSSDWVGLYVSLLKMKKQKATFPTAVVLTDDQNPSVFHHAVRKAPNALILLLLDVMTSCTTYGLKDDSPEIRMEQYFLCRDNKGNTPLHLACANLQVSLNSSGEVTIDFSVIKNLLLLGRQALGMQNNAGDTPFHLILASGAFRELSVSVEKMVVESTLSILAMAKHMSLCPLLVLNKHGYAPLHICAKLNSPTILTQTILESNSSVASIVTSKSDKTPLKLAMSTLMKVGNSHDTAELRNALANVAALATPEACVVLDAKNQTPLMNAVQSKNWSTVLSNILLKAHPDSASLVTPGGYLALHFACQNEKIKNSTVKGTSVFVAPMKLGIF
jgi:ankyrin repeat protein